MAYKRLGDILIANGAITGEQLQKALEIQRQSGARLGNVLVEEKFISEDQLIDALREQLGVEFVDLASEVINPALASLLPKKIAREHMIVPVRSNGDDLYVAMVDPLNFVAIDEAKQATKRRIIPLIATTSAMDRALVMLYGSEGANKALEELELVEGDSSDQADVETHTLDSDDTNSAPTIRLVNSIIERAAAEGASDIHLEPHETEMAVRMRIDGVLRKVLSVPKKSQSAVISRIKVIGAMDIAERRIPQDGRANVRVRGADIDLRISTLPTIYGEKVVIRLLNKSSQLISLEGVGLTGQNLENVLTLLRNSNGVILIVGPTGSGKSSTMSAMVQKLNTEQVNLVTLEDPVEYNINGVNQVQINEKTGMTFASGLRSILRQDPDIIAVGEIRDGETSEIAMRSAITGHLVISTLHTNDAVSTIDRLVDMGTPVYLLYSALRGVISQRLVRRICPRCREEYTPTDEELRLLGLSRAEVEKHHIYHGKGCPDCFETGYRGRTAVFEIMMINDRVRQVIARSGSRQELLEVLKEDGFHTLLDDCMRLVYDGVTSLEEVFRTINAGD
ncbi:MAG: type II/IV secretion system protein [Clostridia bacterium]|nr:type II/IV secretion system protein [Clostridia bacterium]